MTTNVDVKLSNIGTGIQQINLINNTANFPLTGVVADNQIDSVSLTDGMVVCLTNQSVTGQIGFCSCAVTGGNYTLTPIKNLVSGTTYNNGAPFLFNVSQGADNNGLWMFWVALSTSHFQQINA